MTKGCRRGNHAEMVGDLGNRFPALDLPDLEIQRECNQEHQGQREAETNLPQLQVREREYLSPPANLMQCKRGAS